MYSTAYILWTFTWFVHFELPFRLKGTEKIHSERFSKFPSNIYSILYEFPHCVPSQAVKSFFKFNAIAMVSNKNADICIYTFRRIKSRQRFNCIIKTPEAWLRQPCPYPFHFLHPYTSYCSRNSHFHFDKKLQAAIISL